MMKRYILAIFAILLVSAGGCASKSRQPDWVSGDSAGYKSAQYLLGRGQAASREEAKDRARADLAKIFQVAVTADSEDVQRFRKDPAEAGQYEERVSRSIATRTDQIIHGIQIAELWQDPASGNYHALAVLPRLQSAASLRQQIAQLDEATANHIEQSRKQDDLFLKIAAAAQAVDSQQERDGLQKSLQVVDVAGMGAEPRWSSAKLKADLDELLKRIRIAAQVTPDSAPGLAEVVAGALTQAGFMPGAGAQADFVLQARLNLAGIGPEDGWYWQRGDLEIALADPDGQVRGSKRWPVKGSAADNKTAALRALNQADAILRQELRKAVIGMAAAADDKKP